MKEFVVYTALRTGVFVAAYAVIGGAAYLITDRASLWPLVVAAFLSLLLSAWLLRERRERLAQHISERAARAAEAVQRASEEKKKED